MIDVDHEELVHLTKSGRIINPSRPPHVATLWRWALSGVSGVKLESVKIGGTRYTSREAIQRFVAALNEPNAVPTPRSAAAEKAGAKLVKMGA